MSGSTIQLFTVGTTGEGSSGASLLNGIVKSDASGNFSITRTYNCPSDRSLVYLVATGGNPGLAAGTNNAALALMAALGTCKNLTNTPFLNINEVTTVAAVNALAPFMSSPTTLGSSTGNASALAAAFNLASEFANMSTGTSPGVGVPTGTSVPTTKINTIANIIAACNNSVGDSPRFTQANWSWKWRSYAKHGKR